jgi:ankyrin repeat protein
MADENIVTKFFQAIEKRNYTKVSKYLGSLPYLANITNENGKTPLQVAIECNYKNIVLLLISKGADVEYANGFFGQTPLHLAASEGHDEIVGILLNNGANINKRSKCDDFTALHKAVSNQKFTCTKLLLERGANVNAREDDENTPLHLAADRGNIDIVTLLVNWKAELDTANLYGETPLHSAAMNGHMQVARLLLNKGANINAKNLKGETPLALAKNCLSIDPYNNNLESIIEVLSKFHKSRRSIDFYKSTDEESPNKISKILENGPKTHIEHSKTKQSSFLDK